MYRDRVLIKGRLRIRDWVHCPKVGATVVLTDKKKIVLVRQYRYGANRTLWEIPAGTLDGKESPVTCARRECEEETGFKPRTLRSLGFFVPSPAGDDEAVYLYLATDLVETGINPDPDEDITVKSFTFTQVKRMLKKGVIRDAKSIIALYRFFERVR